MKKVKICHLPVTVKNKIALLTHKLATLLEISHFRGCSSYLQVLCCAASCTFHTSPQVHSFWPSLNTVNKPQLQPWVQRVLVSALPVEPELRCILFRLEVPTAASLMWFCQKLAAPLCCCWFCPCHWITGLYYCLLLACFQMSGVAHCCHWICFETLQEGLFPF